MTLQAFHRSPLARRCFGVLVVLVFGLKALMPTGFMLASIDGHAQLVMCPAGAHHAHHAAHAAIAAQQCPFALASGAALAVQAQAPAEPYFTTLQSAHADAVVSVPLAPPLRHRAPRGPPALA